jgi:hypothetical protein
MSKKGDQFHLRLNHPPNQTPPTRTILKVPTQRHEHADEHDVPTKNPLRAPISGSVAPGPRSGELPPLRHPLLQFPLRRQEFLELELDDAHVPYIYPYRFK